MSLEGTDVYEPHWAMNEQQAGYIRSLDTQFGYGVSTGSSPYSQQYKYLAGEIARWSISPPDGFVANTEVQYKRYGDGRMVGMLIETPYLFQGTNAIQPWISCSPTTVAMKLQGEDVNINADRISQDTINFYYANGQVRTGFQTMSPSGAIGYMTQKGLDGVFGGYSQDGISRNVYEGIIENYKTLYMNTDLYGGHVILGVGYDGSGIIANDPAGKYRIGFNPIAQTPLSGKNVHYSWEWVRLYRMGFGYAW